MVVDEAVVDVVVDVGVVVRSGFGEVSIVRAEDVPLAHVNGRLLRFLFLFPVGNKKHKKRANKSASLWNGLEDDVKNISSMYIFKRKTRFSEGVWKNRL